MAWRLLQMIAAILPAVFVNPGLFFAPFVLDAVWVFGSSRRALHDHLFDTVVIQRRDPGGG